MAATLAWDDQSQPPAYSASAAHGVFPYEPPSTFVVGPKTLKKPLVRVGELKAHLSFLRAFKDLRTLVENGQIEEWPEVVRILDPSQRWTWFVGLAVDRFQRWIDALNGMSLGATLEYELPPLDVIMVWHAYLLYPSWYTEDCMRLAPLSPLRGVRDHLLSALVRIRDVPNHDATPGQKELWLQRTGLPYDPITSATLATEHTVHCPKCLESIFVPYVQAEGTGYLQSKFRATCSECGIRFNRQSLGALKFARNLVLDPRNEWDRRRYGQSVYLAGSLKATSNPWDEQMAVMLKIKLSVVFPPPGGGSDTADKNEWIKAIMKQINYSMRDLRRIGAPAFGDSPRSARILSAYIDDRPFSVELVGAVIRQGSFIDKMHHYGWTEPGAYDRKEDEVVIQHAIARYHAFLDLMASSPQSFFIPTLDIDLAWHTHQMKGETYQNDCKEYLRHLVDHEDKVEENRLATAFDNTCKAWEARYHVPYTYCGCPLPNPSSNFAHRLTRLTLRSSLSTGLIPPQRFDALAATHASEHNSVYVPSQDSAVRKAREEKMLKRRLHDAELAKKGKLDRETVSRAAGHQVAFLGPVDAIAPPAFSGFGDFIADGSVTGANG